MKLVLDVQGFKTGDQIFLPKELAAYDGQHFTHYIFKPPFSLTLLDKKFQNQAKWLMNHHHCIDWNEGFTPTFQFKNIIGRLSKRADVIYVKGLEKANFIKTFTNKLVIEFEDQPALKPSEAKCFYHLNPICICSLSNVYQMYNDFVMQ